MTIKIIGIDKDITITDNVRFILSTTDSSGCLKTPYKINKATIYFISREFAETSVSEYSNNIYDPLLLKKYEEQKQVSCVSPSAENIAKLNLLKKQLDNSKFTSPFFFKEAIPIKIFGGYQDEIIGVNDINIDPHGHAINIEKPYEGEIFPAWLNPDLVPEEIKNKVKEENILYVYEEKNNTIEGKFVLDWSPIGCREGDYFICWDWTPNVAGDSISAHLMFSLGSNSKMTASIPAHYTKEKKYEILMEKYLPEMFKNILSESDISPYVLQELNLSVAKGFTFVEDMANQIIDLLDANCIHEQLLPLLSNMFNLKLRSGDPTLWRRQTKKAISNFKKKGTIRGLRSALSDAGIKLLKLTRLWQVVSKYTYQEHFVKTDSNIFRLTKNITFPLDENNFELWIRKKNSNYWDQLDSTYVEFKEENLGFNCVWIGGDLPVPLNLEKGDSIRILYQIADIPDIDAQNIENYIRILDIMDQRDEREQTYPLKNWNTRVIEEDDPLFDIIIPNKHPIQDLVVWGRVRTEFPYSENVYNMEEYNGSTRDSTNPCDLGKDFLDPCKDCQASSFSIDVEIENLSNDRILECQQVVEEFVPFHSKIHSINFLGSKNEFVKPPIEEVQALITISQEEVLISGEAQHIFTRAIANSNKNLVKRNVLAQIEDKTGAVNGSGYNRSILLFSPSFSKKSDLENENFSKKSSGFFRKNISTNYIEGTPFENSNLLEILSPSANAGVYSISKVSKDSLEVVSQGLNAITEPLNKSQFEFRVSNKIHQQNVDITQNDLTIFTCDFNLSKIKIISQKDIDEKLEVGSPYKIRMNDSEFYEFDILEILPDNKLIIKGPLNSDEFSIEKEEINWKLIDYSKPPEESVLASGKEGSVHFVRRGLVNMLATSNSFEDVREIIKIGDYLLYDQLDQYKVKSFLKENKYKFYIENYNRGNVGGISIIIYRRVIENCVGQLDYNGLILKTEIDYENDLLIQNGKNSRGLSTKSNNLKENYLILIGSQYYSILEIDTTTIILDGPNNDWTTLGTNVNFTIYKFTKQSLEIPESNYPKIPGHKFEQIGRSSNEVIEHENELKVNSLLTNKILNSINSGNEVFDSSGQVESINFDIEYKNEE